MLGGWILTTRARNHRSELTRTLRREKIRKKRRLSHVNLAELSLVFSLVSRSACKGQRGTLPRRQKQLSVGRKHS